MSPLNKQEKKTAFAISLAFFMRVFGLSAILPIFANHTNLFSHTTPFLTGLALGIYGFTQAILQLPLGILSDKIGRKPIIYFGFFILALGSFLCATAQSIFQVILGRAMQGACAIGSTLLATLSDLTRKTQRTKVMAVVGASLGLAFASSLVLGPLFSHYLGLRGLFSLTSLFAIFGLGIIFFGLPRIPNKNKLNQKENEIESHGLHANTQVFQKDLFLCYAGAMVIHFLLIANFTSLPHAIIQHQVISISNLWKLYLPVMLVSFLLMLPLIFLAEAKNKSKMMLIISGVLIMLGESLFIVSSGTLTHFIIALISFFTGFSLLEALLPSLISRHINTQNRGKAMGIYSTSQFFGIFLGGVIGGWLEQKYPGRGVFVAGLAFVSFWSLCLCQLSHNFGSHKKTIDT